MNTSQGNSFGRPTAIKTAARLSSAALLALGGACSADGVNGVNPDEPSTLNGAMRAYDVRIALPAARDGALMLDVAGVAVDSVTSGTGSVMRLDVADSDAAVRVVYSGALSDGVIATVWVRGIKGTPVVTIREAAAGAHLAALPLNEFTVTTSARQHSRNGP